MFTKKEYILIGLAALVVAVIVGFQIQTNNLIASMQNVGGNLTATPGIQQSTDPVTTMSNVDVYDLDVTNRFSVDGTSTIAQSYDGFVVFNDVTVATGSPKLVYTNSTGVDMICDRNTGVFYSNVTGYGVSLNISLGEMSSATTYSDGGLIASTTIATSTDTMTFFTATTPFLFENGNSLVVGVGDYTALASSTYFSNWDMELGIDCRLIGQ
ncbi:MAG: hypothetical protein WCW93_03770 [Candidatus Paceibacterota bacterium]|jgi:hypothetical protein